MDENNENKVDGVEGYTQKRIFNDTTGSSESNSLSGESGHSTRQVVEVDIDKLKEFENHPFEPYTGKRFNALVESIRHNDVHNPIIIRPAGEDTYEILSGHNRVRASKEADKQMIPAMIMTDLTQEEAWLVVTETNLYQRSTTDMNHSELAMAISAHYEATKRQGSRVALIQHIEEIESMSDDADASGAVRQKSDTRKEVGALYGMSSRNLGYYIRIDKLIDQLKEMLDKGKIAKRTAVALSHLSAGNQQILCSVLSKKDYNIRESQAETLRALAKEGLFNQKKVKEILSEPKPSAVTPLKLNPNRLKEFFDFEKQETQDVEDEIMEALKFYREHKTS